MMNQTDAEDLPTWLTAVAVKVDELVKQPAALEHFRQKVCEWKAEHDARGPRKRRDRHGRIQYNEVNLLPRRRLSLAKKYAVLAAIHDDICEQATRIDPWGTHKGPQRTGVPKAKSGTAFAVLLSRVTELTETSRDRVEGTLRDVESDLADAAAQCNAESARSDARPMPDTVVVNYAPTMHVERHEQNVLVHAHVGSRAATTPHGQPGATDREPADSPISRDGTPAKGSDFDGQAIPGRVRKVGQEYTQAAEAMKEQNPNPTDREVYDTLSKAHEQAGEANDLPEFATWARYLRDWRKATKRQKNAPRAGRAQVTGSLVAFDQIEPEQLPESVRPRWAGQSGCGADD